jgi:hypothetical protein
VRRALVLVQESKQYSTSVVVMDAVNRIHQFYVDAYWQLHRESHIQCFAGNLPRRSIGRIRRLLAWHLGPLYRALKVFAVNWREHRNIGRHLIQLIRFSYEYRVNPESYYRVQLYDYWKRRNDYVYNDEKDAVLCSINRHFSATDDRDINDKRRFFQRCASTQVPVIPIVAEFAEGNVTNHEYSNKTETCDLFQKPACCSTGVGTALWRLDDGKYTGKSGRLTRAELWHLLTQMSATRAIILQPRIYNHEALVAISGRALSTVRIVTIRDVDGDLRIVLASLRMAIGDQVADNFALGGISSPISLETGMLGPAKRKCSVREEFITHHPDTNAPVEGAVLPFWAEAKKLAFEAHKVFASLPSVGWDVGITNDGPVVVEGNSAWCSEFIQTTHRMPLADTIVPNCLAPYLDEAQKVPCLPQYFGEPVLNRNLLVRS